MTTPPQGEAVTTLPIPASPPVTTVPPPIVSFAEDQLLASYVDRTVPDTFTEEAKAALLFEAKQYVSDTSTLAEIQRRADRDAEKVLRIHVVDSVNFLRNKRDSPMAMVADWCKWVGFMFVGFGVQQWINVKGQKHIASGSVTWLVVDTLISATLIVSGFKVDRPLGYFSGRFHKKSK